MDADELLRDAGFQWRRLVHLAPNRPGATVEHCRRICRGSNVVIDVDDKACPCCGGMVHDPLL